MGLFFIKEQKDFRCKNEFLIGIRTASQITSVSAFTGRMHVHLIA